MAGSSTIYLQTAANLFCGDHDPTKSKHLTLEEMALPSLEELFEEHKPGGAVMQVEFGVGYKKLEPTFKLKGDDPDLAIQFGLGSKIRNTFTSYGVIMDRRTGRSLESKAIIEARLGKVARGAFSRGTLVGHEYALNEVMHYELYFDGKEQLYWDFFTNVWRINGQDENAAENSILRIS